MRNTLWRSHKRSVRLFLLVLSLVIFLVSGLYCWARKEELGKGLTRFFTERISTLFGLDTELDGVGGSLFGTFVLKGVRIYSTDGEARRLFFKGDEVVFEYRIWDVLGRNFSSWLRITLKKPSFYADVPLRFKPVGPRAHPGSFELFSKGLARVKRKTQVVIREGTVAWLATGGNVSGIEGALQDRSFNLEFSMNHIPLGSSDLSTTLFIKGYLKPSEGEDRLEGVLSTQGTVVNWKPFPFESQVNFVMTPDRLQILEASSLLGFGIKGELRREDRLVSEIEIHAKKYPLGPLNHMARLPAGKELRGFADLDVSLSGVPLQPMVKGRVIVKETRMDQKEIKNLHLNFEGVWPEFKVSQSRIVLADGTTMAFADREAIHARELFDTRTYERLISHEDQDEVLWKNWRLIREEDGGAMALQREIGDRMKIRYERVDKDEARFQSAAGEDEVELEVLLSGSESFKMKLQEDDEFVGVEKKVAF